MCEASSGLPRESEPKSNELKQKGVPFNGDPGDTFTHSQQP